MNRNRRKSIRRALDWEAAVIAADGTWEHTCEILDVSETGAQISIDPGISLPSAFFLSFTQDGKVSRQCVVVWRGGGKVGVRFTGERPPIAALAR
jgi:PilZ domain